MELCATGKITEKKYRPRVISLFSGCGGFDLGFHQCGYETVWANDFEKVACDSFRRNIADIIHHGDIEKITPGRNVPSCDLVIGGFPCQDFSILGKQQGFNNARGLLYKNLVRFVAAKKPLAFVVENVKGLTMKNNRYALEAIVKEFEHTEPGYMIIPKVYNFADYGVPQLRERVLLVGIRKDTGFNFKHPNPTHGDNLKKKRVTTGVALANVEQVAYNNEACNHTPGVVELIKKIDEGKRYADLLDSEKKKLEISLNGYLNNRYVRLHRNKLAYTITCGISQMHYKHHRILTCREAARLQSFPDYFVFCGSKTSVYKQVGNAVPPKGVHALAKALMPLFTGNYERVNLYKRHDTVIDLPVNERLKNQK